MTSAVVAPPGQRPGRSVGSWTRPQAGLLAAAVGYSLVAGAWGVQHRAGPWMDEAAAITTAGRPLGGVLSVIAEHERNMALFFVLLHGWMLVSDDFRWLAVLPLVFSVATVLAVARLGHVLAGPAVAATAAALTAANGALLRFSIEVRGYSLGVLLAVVVVLGLAELVRSGRRRWGVLLLCAGLLFVTTTVLAVLLTGALLLAVVLVPQLRGRAPIAWLLVLGAGQGAVDLVVLLADTGNVDWVPPLSAVAVARAAYTLAGGPAGVLVGVLGVAVLLRREGRRPTAATVLVLLWLVAPVVGLVVFSLLKPLFVTKYLLFVVPALALAVAAGLRHVRWPTAVGALAAAALAVGGLLQPWTVREGDVEAAADAVLTHLQPGDAVVYAPTGTRALYGYWLGSWAGPGPRPVDVALADGGTPYETGDPYGEDAPADVVASRVAAAPRTWLVEYHHPGEGEAAPDVLAGFAPVQRFDFGAASVTLLVPRR